MQVCYTIEVDPKTLFIKDCHNDERNGSYRLSQSPSTHGLGMSRTKDFSNLQRARLRHSR